MQKRGVGACFACKPNRVKGIPINFGAISRVFRPLYVTFFAHKMRFGLSWCSPCGASRTTAHLYCALYCALFELIIGKGLNQEFEPRKPLQESFRLNSERSKAMIEITKQNV